MNSRVFWRHPQLFTLEKKKCENPCFRQTSSPPFTAGKVVWSSVYPRAGPARSSPIRTHCEVPLVEKAYQFPSAKFLLVGSCDKKDGANSVPASTAWLFLVRRRSTVNSTRTTRVHGVNVWLEKSICPTQQKKTRKAARTHDESH